jgi:hypothetical protein
MANGLKLTEVKSYQAYVQEFSNELIAIALNGFRTAQFLKEETGIQGKKTFSVMKSNGRVLKAFSTTYSGTGDKIEMIPRTIETYVTKAEMDIVPSDIRASYLGAFTLPNQDVLPAFLVQIVSYFIARLMTDIDELVWAGDKDGGASNVLDTLNGIDKQIAVAVAASDLTEIATGTISASDVIAKFTSVYDAMADVHKVSMIPLYLYCSKKNKDLYARAVQVATNMYTNPNEVKTMLFGTDCEIVDVPAWAGTSKVLVAPKGAIIYGYDQASAMNNINVIRQHYTLEHSVTPEIGVLIVTPWDGEIAVNDQF